MHTSYLSNFAEKTVVRDVPVGRTVKYLHTGTECKHGGIMVAKTSDLMQMYDTSRHQKTA